MKIFSCKTQLKKNTHSLNQLIKLQPTIHKRRKKFCCSVELLTPYNCMWATISGNQNRKVDVCKFSDFLGLWNILHTSSYLETCGVKLFDSDSNSDSENFYFWIPIPTPTPKFFFDSDSNSGKPRNRLSPMKFLD
jgi:hypothetical protein